MTSISQQPAYSPSAPSTWPGHEQYPWLLALDSKFDRFLWKLNRRDLTSSSSWAKTTLSLFKEYLEHAANVTEPRVTAGEAVVILRRMSEVLVNARPIELVVGNIARRVLHSIRQEAIVSSIYTNDKDKRSVDNVLDSVHPFLNPVFGRAQTFSSVPLSDIYSNIETTLGELLFDVNETDKNVAVNAEQQIFPNETILTYGYSRTLHAFLKKAKETRDFHVFVAESAPSLSGRKFASLLAKDNINVTLIPDADIFSIRPVVTKIFIGAHAVLANGGLIAMIGANNLCCASDGKIPVIVLCGVHKISPTYAFDQETYNEYNNPAQVLQFDDCLEGRIDVINPGYDYVTPENVHLFITDGGIHPPSCIYRQLSELYSTEDYSLESTKPITSSIATPQ